jgi:hypothetical protein
VSRQILGFEEGDTLVAHEEGGRLVLEKQEMVKQRLKARFAHVPKTRSLVDELIAQRREGRKGKNHCIIKISLFWSKIKMRKQTIQYTSSLDALIAVVKRLSIYENQYKMDSEDFYNHYNQGKLSDDIMFIEWANDYRHYLALHQDLEQKLNHAA